MKDSRYILQFVCYEPRIYARADKEFVVLAQKLRGRGYIPVFIYADTLTAVPQIQKDLESAGAIVEILPTKNKWTMILSIRRLYKKYRPCVVDVHFMPIVKAYAALYSCTHGVRHFSHLRSLIADSTPQEYQKRKGFVKRFLLGINYSFLGGAGKVVCVTSAVEKQFREWAYAFKSSAITIFGGVPIIKPKLTKAEARELLGLPYDKIVITNVSAIEHIKGIDLIIKAVALMKKRGVDVMFAHIGGFRSDTQFNRDYADSLKQLAHDNGVTDSVVWLGKRFDVQDILPAFDIYVHPSRSEALAGALLEASAAGLPLVGSNIGGIPDAIINDVNGFLCENENIEQIAQSIQKLVENKELRNNMGEAAQRRVYSNYDINVQTDKLISAYGIN